MAFRFRPKLGIDLGTTTVLVFVPGRGIVLNEPSVVAVSVIDNKILAIGNEAKEMVQTALKKQEDIKNIEELLNIIYKQRIKKEGR